MRVRGVSAVGQTEIHTAEPLVSGPSAFELCMAIEKLKRYKSPGIGSNFCRIDSSRIRIISS
jgi:hypothetical protein